MMSVTKQVNAHSASTMSVLNPWTTMKQFRVNDVDFDFARNLLTVFVYVKQEFKVVRCTRDGFPGG